ncbi:MAG TPA: VWA domain-containing protein [Vicinamibacteria bacterium]|nr:VWA domain-containing protein [Vicinamibacteria bacterium]
MSSIFLGVFLLAQAAPASEAEVLSRTVTVTVTDEKGAPVSGLAREDVALVENGVARDVVSFSLDRRPLTVVFLLDTSEAIQPAYRLHVVPAVTAFFAGLPEGTQFALWTLGERPQKRVDYTDDKARVDQALKRVAPAGGSTLLDGLMEATKDLKKKEGEHNAVVVVSATGPEFSSTYRERVVESALLPDTTFLSVLLEEGATDNENRTNYDFVLDGLAKKSGGVLANTLSSMGLDRELKGLLACLTAQYRLTYATPPELKQRKLEVTVAHPGTKVRIQSPPPAKKG